MKAKRENKKNAFCWSKKMAVKDFFLRTQFNQILNESTLLCNVQENIQKVFFCRETYEHSTNFRTIKKGAQNEKDLQMMGYISFKIQLQSNMWKEQLPDNSKRKEFVDGEDNIEKKKTNDKIIEEMLIKEQKDGEEEVIQTIANVISMNDIIAWQ